MNTDTSSLKESFPTNGGGDDDEIKDIPKKYFRLQFLPLAEGEHLPWDIPDQNPKYQKSTSKRYAEVFSSSVIY